MGCVPELLANNLRELIFDVFPVVQLERHEISSGAMEMHTRCQPLRDRSQARA
jgi:hypothetical protein